MDQVALRLQRFDLQFQTLALSELAADRSDDRTFSPGDVPNCSMPLLYLHQEESGTSLLR